MPIVEWSDDYSVGNEAIDNQHKKLFEILNRLHDGLFEGFDERVCGAAIERLLAYANYHFAAEEHFMAEVRYSGIYKHSQEHKKFIETITQLRNATDMDKRQLAKNLLEFLVNWILHHILIEDAKIARTE